MTVLVDDVAHTWVLIFYNLDLKAILLEWHPSFFQNIEMILEIIKMLITSPIKLLVIIPFLFSFCRFK